MTTRKTITIPWPAGLLIHGGVAHEIVLQEPSYDDYLTVGDPVTIVNLGDGKFTSVIDDAVIRQYIARCLVNPKDPLVIEAGGMKLAVALKGAVLGFFQGDASETDTSKTSPQTSSSDAARDASAPAT